MLLTLDIFISLVETNYLLNSEGRTMILFPGISPKVMLRALFPFIFTTIAIAAILAAYIHFTDDICSDIVRMEQEQVIQAAKSINGISMDESMSILMFNRRQSEGFVYLDLKPEFLGSFNLSECTIVYPIHDDVFEGVPFEEDSLTRIALTSGSPVMQYMEMGKENSLLVFYPVIDSSRNISISRMVFEIINRTTYWISVNMNISWAHENRNLNFRSLEIFCLLGFFNYNDFSISRSINDIIICDMYLSNRISEKL